MSNTESNFSNEEIHDDNSCYNWVYNGMANATMEVAEMVKNGVNATVEYFTPKKPESNSGNEENKGPDWDYSQNVKGLTNATTATVLTAMSTNAFGGLATLLGFSNPGIIAGTWAVKLMSVFGTPGWISALQSAGALFGGGVVAATAAVAVPIAVGVGVYNYSVPSRKENPFEDDAC